MKKLSFTAIILLMIVSAQAQNKKWTLEECVNYALSNNITIKLSEIETKNAEIEKSAAFGSFLPSINASTNHSWNIGLNQNITTGLLENQTTQFTSVGLNAGVTIYNGLQNQNRLRRSNLSIIAAQYQIAKIKDDISLNVANAFLQILYNKENINILKLQLENNQKSLQRTDALVQAGSIPRGDLYDSRATIASDEQKIVAAENQLLISKLSLAQLLQLDNFQTFDIEDENYPALFSGVMLQTPEEIIKKARENRNELKIARTNVELAEKDIKIAKGAYQPTLEGFYSFSSRVSYADRFTGIALNTVNPTSQIGFVEGTNQAVLEPNFTPILGKPLPFFDQISNNKGQNFGLQLRVPIFNGFSVKNNVERSKVALERTKLNLQQTELDIERTVFTAVADAKGAFNTMQSAIVSLEARELAYNYAKERYAVGMMNAFDFNQAQLLFANAQSEVLRTKYDYIFRTKIVEFYFGLPISKN